MAKRLVDGFQLLADEEFHRGADAAGEVGTKRAATNRAQRQW
jgi:hypothetical protein